MKSALKHKINLPTLVIVGAVKLDADHAVAGAYYHLDSYRIIYETGKMRSRETYTRFLCIAVTTILSNITKPVPVTIISDNTTAMRWVKDEVLCSNIERRRAALQELGLGRGYEGILTLPKELIRCRYTPTAFLFAGLGAA